MILSLNSDCCIDVSSSRAAGQVPTETCGRSDQNCAAGLESYLRTTLIRPETSYVMGLKAGIDFSVGSSRLMQVAVPA